MGRRRRGVAAPARARRRGQRHRLRAPAARRAYRPHGGAAGLARPRCRASPAGCGHSRCAGARPHHVEAECADASGGVLRPCRIRRSGETNTKRRAYRTWRCRKAWPESNRTGSVRSAKGARTDIRPAPGGKSLQRTSRSKQDMARMRAGIVGAGIAGASCAGTLAAAGWEVDVFEKARGAGGRLSTKRIEQGWATLGSPFISAKRDPFRSQLRDWVRQGWLEPVRSGILQGRANKAWSQAQLQNHYRPTHRALAPGAPAAGRCAPAPADPRRGLAAAHPDHGGRPGLAAITIASSAACRPAGHSHARRAAPAARAPGRRAVSPDLVVPDALGRRARCGGHQVRRPSAGSGSTPDLRRPRPVGGAQQP